MKHLPFAALALCLGSSIALAQSTQTPPPAPGATVPPTTTAPPAMTPPVKRTEPGATIAGDQVVLTEEQARTWIDKIVYSSDGKNLGEVAAFARDGGGKVTELHADVGGFLGMGETRVRLLPSQFRLERDAVIVLMTAEQAKTLPQIPMK